MKKTNSAIMFHFFTILVVLMSYIFTSCLTRKACEKRFPVRFTDSSLEEVKSIVTYRDTIIVIKLSGDTIFRTGDLSGGISKLSTPMVTSYAWVKDGKLEHRLEQKDTLIKKKLPRTIEKTIYTNTNKHITSNAENEGILSNNVNWGWLPVIILLIALALLLQISFIRR